MAAGAAGTPVDDFRPALKPGIQNPGVYLFDVVVKGQPPIGTAVRLELGGHEPDGHDAAADDGDDVPFF